MNCTLFVLLLLIMESEQNQNKVRQELIEMGFEGGRVDEVLAQVASKEDALALLLPSVEGEEEFED